MHRVAAVVEGDRLAPHRFVAVEVLQRDDAAAALHLRRDQGGGLSAVEVVGPLVAEPREDGGKLRLRERVADPGDGIAGEEDARALREGADPLLRRIERRNEACGDLEPVRQVDGGLHDLGPRERAEALVRLP